MKVFLSVFVFLFGFSIVCVVFNVIDGVGDVLGLDFLYFLIGFHYILSFKLCEILDSADFVVGNICPFYQGSVRSSVIC